MAAKPHFISGLGAVVAKVKTVEEVRVRKAASSARNRIVRNLSGSRSGRVYSKPGGGKYTASAPGEYPAVRLGDLKGHIRWKIRKSAWITDAIVGTDQAHGAILEKKDIGAGGRPWLERSLKEEKSTTRAILGARWF